MEPPGRAGSDRRTSSRETLKVEAAKGGLCQMGKMGDGYGSEFHLLRYLGYHRDELSSAVEKVTRGRVLRWLDFAFSAKGKYPQFDSEWKGLDFVDTELGIRSAWNSFWPQTGNVPNWDAVGLLESGSNPEFLLVEAKAHVGEIRSNCGASEKGGLEAIRRALEATIKENDLTANPDSWLRPYYQYANRLAHLHFLLQRNVSARLIFIYFLGDNWDGKTLQDGKAPCCPKDQREWEDPLETMYKHLGLNGQGKLEEHVHRLFLPVWRPPGESNLRLQPLRETSKDHIPLTQA